MVKLLLQLFVRNLVAVLELAGVVCLVLAAGFQFGRVGVLTVVAVALLVKSFELDLQTPPAPPPQKPSSE